MNLLSKFLARMQDQDEQHRVTVIGDAMIDEYFSAKTTKISPEFPVPVINHPDGKPYLQLPGGAGNVVRQFENFPFKVDLIAFLDEEAKAIYEKHNVGVDLSLEIDHKIPRKQRYYQDDFALARIDIEQKNYGYNEGINQIRNQLIYNSKYIKSKIVIFSDYDKGVLNEMWYLPDKITIVDPKKGPLSKWIGCKIIKPNAIEAKELTGRSDWRSQCDVISDVTNCDSVVITQGPEGVVGWSKYEGYFHYIPAKAIRAISVIGAGDCFISYFSMAYILGFAHSEAAQIAFEISSQYVQSKYNKPLTLEDIQKHADPFAAKFHCPPKKRDYRLIFTNGVFDAGLTAAHVAYLNEAKRYGHKLVVALNSDESVKRLKGPNRPVLTLQDRMNIVASLECVDYVVSFEEDTPLELVKKIMPDLIVKGGDYKAENVAGYGIVEVLITKTFPGMSTTDKLNCLK